MAENTPDEVKAAIGKRLKKLRQEKDYSLQQECDALNVKYALKITKSMMSRWENGISQPSNVYLSAYAKLHEVDLNWIVGLASERRKLITPFAMLSSEKRSVEDDLIAIRAASITLLDEEILLRGANPEKREKVAIFNYLIDEAVKYANELKYITYRPKNK